MPPIPIPDQEDVWRCLLLALLESVASARDSPAPTTFQDLNREMKRRWNRHLRPIAKAILHERRFANPEQILL